MKKIIMLFVIPIAAMIITSCNSDDNPVNPTPKGSIYLSSNPAGAEIWLDGTNTSKTTPDTVKNIDEGIHNVTLKLQDYEDTTISVSVSENQTSVLGPVVLVSNIITTLFGPVRIYETFGTSASQPSGLDLSNGNAYGVSSTEGDSVDIYYSSTGFLVQSAHLNTTNGLTRVTKFRVATGTDLNDGVNSPLQNSGTWTDNMGDRENNYVFLYDDDGHYSKAKITLFGGGTPGNPAWVELTWWYNNVADDERF
jgi:hypothetical protein